MAESSRAIIERTVSSTPRTFWSIAGRWKTPCLQDLQQVSKTGTAARKRIAIEYSLPLETIESRTLVACGAFLNSTRTLIMWACFVARSAHEERSLHFHTHETISVSRILHVWVDPTTTCIVRYLAWTYSTTSRLESLEDALSE